MASVNKGIIVGNLGRDPELRYMPSGDAIANIAVATSYKSKDRQTGEQKELTEWHRISFFGRLAEIVGEYLKKGSSVYVEGRLQTRKWVGKDDVERIAVEIIADDMRMLGGRPHEHDGESEHADAEHQADADQTQAQQRDTGTASRAGGSRFDLIDDAIPF